MISGLVGETDPGLVRNPKVAAALRQALELVDQASVTIYEAQIIAARKKSGIAKMQSLSKATMAFRRVVKSKRAEELLHPSLAACVSEARAKEAQSPAK